MRANSCAVLILSLFLTVDVFGTSTHGIVEPRKEVASVAAAHGKKSPSCVVSQLKFTPSGFKVIPMFAASALGVVASAGLGPAGTMLNVGRHAMRSFFDSLEEDEKNAAKKPQEGSRVVVRDCRTNEKDSLKKVTGWIQHVVDGVVRETRVKPKQVVKTELIDPELKGGELMYIPGFAPIMVQPLDEGSSCRYFSKQRKQEI